MNRNIFKLALILLVLAVLLPACASQTGRSYSASETRKAQSVKFGVVTQIRDAVIEDDPSGAGTLGGAVAGGVIGSAFGGGSGRFYTTAAGAALGALGAVALGALGSLASLRGGAGGGPPGPPGGGVCAGSPAAAARALRLRSWRGPLIAIGVLLVLAAGRYEYLALVGQID